MKKGFNVYSIITIIWAIIGTIVLALFANIVFEVPLNAFIDDSFPRFVLLGSLCAVILVSCVWGVAMILLLPQFLCWFSERGYKIFLFVIIVLAMVGAIVASFYYLGLWMGLLSSVLCVIGFVCGMLPVVSWMAYDTEEFGACVGIDFIILAATSFFIFLGSWLSIIGYYFWGVVIIILVLIFSGSVLFNLCKTVVEEIFCPEEPASYSRGGSYIGGGSSSGSYSSNYSDDYYDRRKEEQEAKEAARRDYEEHHFVHVRTEVESSVTHLSDKFFGWNEISYTAKFYFRNAKGKEIVKTASDRFECSADRISVSDVEYRHGYMLSEFDE